MPTVQNMAGDWRSFLALHNILCEGRWLEFGITSPESRTVKVGSCFNRKTCSILHLFLLSDKSGGKIMIFALNSVNSCNVQKRCE